MKAFWMCLLDGGGAPTFRHDTAAAAHAEAERLARAHGRPCFVLRAVAAVERRDVTWTQLEADANDEIPF